MEANDQEEEVEGGLDGDRCDALPSVMGARSPLAAGGGTRKHKSWDTEGRSAVRGDTHVAVCPRDTVRARDTFALILNQYISGSVVRGTRSGNLKKYDSK